MSRDSPCPGDPQTSARPQQLKSAQMKALSRRLHTPTHVCKQIRKMKRTIRTKEQGAEDKIRKAWLCSNKTAVDGWTSVVAFRPLLRNNAGSRPKTKTQRWLDWLALWKTKDFNPKKTWRLRGESRPLLHTAESSH